MAIVMIVFLSMGSLLWNDLPDRTNLVLATEQGLNVKCCDEQGLAVFHVLRRRQNEETAFDLLELYGADMRREPIEVRKATLASILRNCRPGVRLNEQCSTTPAVSFTRPLGIWKGQNYSFRSAYSPLRLTP
jgi:hypothetical protein